MPLVPAFLTELRALDITEGTETRRFEVLEPFVAWSTRYEDDAHRTEYLDSFAERLRHLDSVPSLPVHAVEDFGPDWTLRPEVEPRTIAHQPWAPVRS